MWLSKPTSAEGISRPESVALLRRLAAATAPRHTTQTEPAIHAAMVIRPFQTGIPDEQDTRAATSDELL
mgnify:CR=1 FL=1